MPKSHSCEAAFEGKDVHKASIVRLLLNEDQEDGSNDRLNRVKGYTKYPQKVTEVHDDLDLDDCIMIGDMLAAKVKMDGATKPSASLCILR